jgi:PKD repeat protein
MRPSRFIKLQVFNLATTTWEDITDGVLSINTVTGSDTFEGYWDQPDTGQFVITTRGNTADPNLNPLITTNSIIKVFVDTPDIPGQFYDEAVFYGFITDVGVEYRKNDTQLVTINGTDLMGYLNRLVVTQEFIDTDITPTYPDQVVPADYLITKATYALAPELQEIFYIGYEIQAGNLPYFPEALGYFNELPPTAKVKVEAGKTLYELIALGMSSGLMRYETAYVPNQYIFLPYYKNDTTFYKDLVYDDEELTDWNYFLNSFSFVAVTNEEDPVPDIENPLGFFTFRGITLNNGLGKMINQVSVNNTDPATGDTLSIEPLSSDANVLQYGPAHLNAQTSYTTTSNPFWLSSSAIADQAEYFQKNVLFDQAEPKTVIETITVDGAKWFNDLSNNQVPDNGNKIYVQHKLDNGEYLSGYYKIVGIKHQITENEWLAEFILKPSEILTMAENRPKTPTFTITADEEPDEDGNYTTATNFTASINNYTTEDLENIESIEWFVNFFALDFMTPRDPGNPPSQLNVSPVYNPSPQLPIFNGTSVTWSFDDNGVLEPYGENGEDSVFSLMIGPGNYKAYVMLTTKDGIRTWFYVDFFGIVGAFAYADFTFTKDEYQKVTFIENSGADTNSWSWNFGDGTTFNGQNPPVKQYAAAGTYNVTLTVDNGFDTATITKPVTIDIYQIPVQYIKLRYQGTVTRPAGATEYPVDLIDTIALLEIKNELFVDTGGIQPFYFGRIGTLEKVQEIGKGNNYQFLRILDDPVTKANHEEWIYQASPLDPAGPNIPYTPYTPLYTTNYASGGPLDPMSQTHLTSWTNNAVRGTVGGTVPKYRFIPVITDNPDGSQTKSIDIDINFWYSQTYITGTKTSSSSSNYRNFKNNRPAGASALRAPVAETYLPGGRVAGLAYWPEWANGAGSSFDQRYKVKEVIVWPGMDTKVNKTTSKQLLTIPGGGGNTDWFFSPPVDPPLDRFGVQPGKTYLPIEIAVSDDGTTFRKIGEAEYVSGNTLTTTYDVSMPPFSNAPILT